MIDTDRYQPILAAMKAEPVPIRRGLIVVHPPEIGSRVGRLDFADRPRCTFDKIEHRPLRIIDACPGQPECPVRPIRPSLPVPCRKPPASKPHRRPFEKFQATGRKFKGIQETPLAALQHHAVSVEKQQRQVVGHCASPHDT